MTEVMAHLKGWTLEIAGIKYCAEALASVPWITLKNLAAEKTKLSDFRQQELEQKSLIWAKEQDILKTINYGEAQIKTGIFLSVRA
ncbi:hypothetical protein OAV86_00830 [Pseudomonadales bacterium]|nr:hypothetical protein [Pseudomonadales bacterium]